MLINITRGVTFTSELINIDWIIRQDISFDHNKQNKNKVKPLTITETRKNIYCQNAY